MLLLIFTTSGGTPPNRSPMTRRDYGTHLKTDWIRRGDRPSCSSACSPPFRGLLIAYDLDADMVMGAHLSPVLDMLCSRCSEAAIIPLNYARSHWAVLTELWTSGLVQWIIDTLSRPFHTQEIVTGTSHRPGLQPEPVIRPRSDQDILQILYISIYSDMEGHRVLIL